MLFPTTHVLPRQVQANQMPSGLPQVDLTRLLGADVAPLPTDFDAPVAGSRLQLLGLVSPRQPQAAREGLALIAVNGMPPKVVRVGAVVEGRDVLLAVDAQSASLGPRDGPARLVLSLAPPPATGTGVDLVRLGSGLAPAPRAAAPAQRPAQLTEQELFQQRQQRQFEEEQMQNQALVPQSPPPTTSTSQKTEAGKLR